MFRLMRKTVLTGAMVPMGAASFLALLCFSQASGQAPLIDGDFVIQPYELPTVTYTPLGCDVGFAIPDPNDPFPPPPPGACPDPADVVVCDDEECQFRKPGEDGYRHMTAVINEKNQEVILYGGLGSGFGGDTEVNDTVFTLDLKKKPDKQEWQIGNDNDNAVARPWFTSTAGFAKFNDKDIYLTCDDSDVNAVYKFDPETYTFEHVSTNDGLGATVASDCCAVAVKARDDYGKLDKRVYILGGRSDKTTASVRYYSITHDEWEESPADMSIARSHLGCAAVHRRNESPLIYAISGGDSFPAGEASEDCPSGSCVYNSIEVYDVAADKWVLYDNYFPQGGRTRLAVETVGNKYIIVIGGDSTCAGGGPGNECPPDQPLTRVEVIDIEDDNKLLSSPDYVIPQLIKPRQTPATALIKQKNNDMDSKTKYSLFVIAGQSRDGRTLPTTERLDFNMAVFEQPPEKVK